MVQIQRHIGLSLIDFVLKMDLCARNGLKKGNQSTIEL